MEIKTDKLESITLESLVEFGSVNFGNGVNISTLPQTVIFEGERFYGEFYFKGQQLRHIKLVPMINGGADRKMEYCRKFMQEHFTAERREQRETGGRTDLWKLDTCIITCSVYKNSYDGGNLIITPKKHD